MAQLRHMFDVRRGWVALLLACALAAKLCVPAGYMPVAEHGRLVLRFCGGVVPAQGAAAAMAAMHHGVDGDMAGAHGKAAKPDMPCAFAGLAAPPLGAVAAGLLAAAILTGFALVMRRAARAPPALPFRLRPPLRAPPLPA